MNDLERTPRRERSPSRLRLWTEEDFAAGREQWAELLARSDADRLFMSWDWQWRWWRHHASFLHSELVLLAGYADDGRLIGLAPLHLRRVTHRWPLNAMRMECLGSAWRDRASVFSEYFDFIVDRDHVSAFVRDVSDALLNDRRWSDCVIGNTRRDSIAAQMVQSWPAESCYLRETDRLIAHVAQLPARFEDYVRTLSASTRRRLWNQRSKLRDVTFTLASADELIEFFGLLDSYQRRRWGAEHYTGVRGRFHLDLATALAGQGLLRMSRLSVEGRPISVMYNVRIGATEYNVQSGFDNEELEGASPGYLHFGFCLERACQEQVQLFDFLAGTGRKRDYKRDFITVARELITVQAIRSRPLGWLYRLYDR
jgi:CelD/BcsL family acetyltransferase involved in cellulose biosynthesis